VAGCGQWMPPLPGPVARQHPSGERFGVPSPAPHDDQVVPSEVASALISVLYFGFPRLLAMYTGLGC